MYLAVILKDQKFSPLLDFPVGLDGIEKEVKIRARIDATFRKHVLNDTMSLRNSEKEGKARIC